MIYFDTSYLAKCYFPEWGADAVRRLAADHRDVACCDLGRLELTATFHRKLRQKEINVSEFATLMKQVRFDEANETWTWLPITSLLITTAAARFLELPANCFVRSADALHLTCAREYGFTSVFSNDRHLISAAPYFGIRAENVIVKT